MPEIVVSIRKKFRELTTFGIGGKIGAYTKITNRKTLLELLRIIKKNNVKYFILGCGSNLLASDVSHDLFVIHICLDEMFCFKNKIVCGAGVGLFKLNTFACKNGLSGLEWSFGIPGSVGGAVRGNAGSFGGEMGNVVEYVYYTDGKKLYRKSGKELDFQYRKSFFSDKNYVILRVVLALTHKPAEEIRKKCEYNFERKKALQPYEKRSAGSVFKRPQNTFAPLLIEKCNLKGLTKGDAQISTKHCGFIVNLNGRAKFRDVYSLLQHTKKIVSKQLGVRLEEEIVILK